MIDLAAHDKLHQAATPGEWYCDSSAWVGLHFGVLVEREGKGHVILDGRERDEQDCTLAAALHNAWPAIKRELEAGRALREPARAILYPIFVLKPGGLDLTESEILRENNLLTLKTALAAYDVAVEEK